MPSELIGRPEIGGEIRFESLILGLWATFATTLLLDVAGFPIPLVQPVVAIVFLTFGLGGLFLRSIGIDPELRADWFVYAVGSGLLVLTGVGVFWNLSHPLGLLETPLNSVELLVGVSLTTFGLVGFVRRRRPTATVPSPDLALFRRLASNGAQNGWQVFLALLLPLAAVLSVTYLNVTNDNLPVVALLVVVAAVPVLVVARVIEERYLPLTIWGTGLAILYHKSFFIGHSFGGHQSVVNIWKGGYWPLEFETLAVNGALMPAFAKLSGVHVITQVEVIMPLFVSALPVAMFVTFRRYTTPQMAFVGCSFFVFSHPFFYQYPSVPRASMPVLFLAMVGTTISDDYHGLLQRRALAALFGVGVVVSHYGTSYYVLFALLGALPSIVVLRWVAGVLERFTLSDANPLGDEWKGESEPDSAGRSRSSVFGPQFVAFYAASALAWYLYVAGGAKFESIFSHVVTSVQSLFSDSEGGGATAARVQTDYGGIAIDLAEYIYVSLALMVGVGLLIVTLRRVVPAWETEFDDGYVALSGFVFLLFAGTFVISGEWGGGRPMMIVLSLNAVFAVIAAVAIGRALARALEAITRSVSETATDRIRAASTDVSGEAAVAVILAAFFLLNAGAMTALVYGERAPSNVAYADVRDEDNTADVQTHAWLADHRNDTYQIYGDRRARAQTTDWINGEISSVAEREPYRFTKSYFFEALNDSTLETGYVLMMQHNVVDGMVEVNYVTTRPIERYTLLLEHRNRVYTNGQGEVYYTDGSTKSVYSP